MKTRESVLLPAVARVGLSTPVCFFTGLIVSDDPTHAYFSNYVAYPNADHGFTEVSARGVNGRRVWLYAIMAGLALGGCRRLRESEQATEQTVVLPLFLQMADDDQCAASKALRQAIRNHTLTRRHP
ncbi:MAG: hypothetical protein ABII12_17625 [Planctomycetota bacterium]|nr:hypothetical protein [Planctomycetota bacterium]